jgi:hypothetical protein
MRAPRAGDDRSARVWIEVSAIAMAHLLACDGIGGLGIMARHAPKLGAVRAINFSVHVVFGLGLGTVVWLAGSA